MNQLLEKALKLPAAERRKLADEIYDSIVSEPEAFALTDAQVSEIERRLADYRTNPEKTVSWAVARDRLRKIA